MRRRGLRTPSLTSEKTASDLLRHWRPHPGPQTRFLLNNAFELLYGGQAGGGKSVGLLAAGALQIHIRDYAGIMFRKTYKQLEEPGGLVSRSHEIYPHVGARYRTGDHRWNFPSGSEIVLRHLQYSNDRYNYQGAEYGFVGFDQLEQFEEADYLYLFSRARSRDPRVTPLVRATANPGSEWVLHRWLPWLGTDEELEQKGWPRAEEGEILWFKRVNDEDVLTTEDDPDSLSRTFIPATIYDNPTLMENDPDYIRRLKALPYVERRRLLEGDWHIKASAGTIFPRHLWTDIRKQAPADMKVMVRAFDFAASGKERQEGDYTATVKMGRSRHREYWFLHAAQERLTPRENEAFLRSFHRTEPRNVEFAIPQDPGQAGKEQYQRYARICEGRTVHKMPRSGDKVQYASPLATQLEAENVVLLEAPWNGWLINHYSNFPDPGWHDDVVDAGADAFIVLTSSDPDAKTMAW